MQTLLLDESCNWSRGGEISEQTRRIASADPDRRMAKVSSESSAADRGIKVSAVLLAGGKSRRMGRDKATTSYRGRPLWRHQTELLGELGPFEILISARSDPPWRPDQFKFVPDGAVSRGPLTGLA